MTFIRTRRAVVGIVAATCIAVPAAAAAQPMTNSDAAQGGWLTGKPVLVSPGSDAAQGGWQDANKATPSPGSDAAQSGGQPKTTFPPAGFRGGDSPVDHPGASRAPVAPTTIEVVRPERTIVREVDEALPLVLSGTALLLALAGLGFTVGRARVLPRPRRTH